MSKAKVGTGELTPFKKGSTGSEKIDGSTTNKNFVREGFTHNVHIHTTPSGVSELTPFKTGPSGPGVNHGNPTVPAFRERDSDGIDQHGFKPFKK